MCYACTQCNKCGKFNEDSPLYRRQDVPCLKCGALIDLMTGLCSECDHVALPPLGERIIIK
jgi:hypothetical protein